MYDRHTSSGSANTHINYTFRTFTLDEFFSLLHRLHLNVVGFGWWWCWCWRCHYRWLASQTQTNIHHLVTSHCLLLSVFIRCRSRLIKIECCTSFLFCGTCELNALRFFSFALMRIHTFYFPFIKLKWTTSAIQILMEIAKVHRQKSTLKYTTNSDTSTVFLVCFPHSSQCVRWKWWKATDSNSITIYLIFALTL